MGKIIMVCSGKGGVGKTTVCAALGHALHRRGKSVLLIDGDMGLRDLDLALGVQDEVLFTSRDLWRKKCLLEDAIITIDTDLDFLSASQKFRWEDVKKKSFCKLVETIHDQYDYVLIDTPSGIGRGLDAIWAISEEAIVVVEPSWMSLRDCQRLLSLFRDERYHNYLVTLNKMDVTTNKETSHNEGILSSENIVDILGIEKLGAILPYDHFIQVETNQGLLHEVIMEHPFGKMMDLLVDQLEGVELPLDIIRSAFKEHCKSIEEEKKTKSSNTYPSRLRRRQGTQWKWSSRRRF